MAVVAPKDAEKKRSGFYIMRNKQITGSLQPDGRGVQFLYQSDGRILSSARLVGGVTDEEMVRMLLRTEDFRKLVYSIGVTVEMDEPEEVDFVFQMYGKTDPYASGTSIRRTVRADGMEYVIKCDEVDWSDDDDVIGQIRFEMDKPGKFANVAVRLYLNDGYTCAEPEDENPADLTSEKYQKMLDASVVQVGDLRRLQKAIMKAKSGEDVTVAYIGGSITQGAGAIPINTECYAYKSFAGICKMAGVGTDENVHYIKAGVGGTPSELGMLRYERDVCREGAVKPDVVIVEFAVNDGGDETGGECYESLVRKILAADNEPAVLLIFAVFADDFNLQDRLAPVGEVYNVPMVSVKDCVVPQFYNKNDRVITKNQYFYDCYHPTNLGHTVMADCILRVVKEAVKEAQEGLKKADNNAAAAIAALGDMSVNLAEITPKYGKEFEAVRLVDRTHTEGVTIVSEGDFAGKDTLLQGVEMDMDLTQTPEFPNNWMHVDGSNPFVMEAECSALVMINKDSASPNAGIAEVFADGEKVLSVNPRLNGWTHCNPLICFRGREKKRVRVEVRMQPGDENKEFTILGFGVVD